MRPRGMTLAEVQKGYRDDGDGDDSLSQRQQQQQAPQLSQERQLLQAAAMIHTALMLVSGVAGVPLPNLQQSRRQSRRRPSRFWYEDAHTWQIVVCTWAAARLPPYAEEPLSALRIWALLKASTHCLIRR